MTPETLAETHAAAFTLTRPWSAAEFATLLDGADTILAGDVRCFALGRIIVDEAELLTIATHPEHRRRGLAADCMAAWQAEATRRGATRAFLEVASDNLPAISLYHRCGFRRHGLRRGYYRRPGLDAADAILMVCDLP
ncbi:ribosomal-protein-alanine N-acetyltransferase [Cribrihabitans marinus]|uniref:Ribosomal-protein-alanine N-acetyltransferase n=1 Tax=Cribrihabitans marinus TaxID=1227549 RepID=A0A1H7CHB9_9RHOB|nr:GNAT family N-acetyltransferase [Cribrihabitans marinus]GGH35563.1 alanine acetyltransferase [Cribrihabitans marinus]SEJ89109.1 ribosomal-protein-alanine N-acetyltransferase [Cribrihabitans marinus]